MIGEFDNLIYRLACLYMGLTEIFDRTLTTKRSQYDSTEAYIPQKELRKLSDINACELRNKIINEYKIRWNYINNEIHKHNNYSAQMWVNEYERLWKENKQLQK